MQTDYVKTSVPSIAAATNISIGAALIVVIVAISLSNFIHSAKKLTVISLFEDNDDKYEANQGEYFGLSSISEYTT